MSAHAVDMHTNSLDMLASGVARPQVTTSKIALYLHTPNIRAVVLIQQSGKYC